MVPRTLQVKKQQQYELEVPGKQRHVSHFTFLRESGSMVREFSWKCETLRCENSILAICKYF